MAQWPTHLSLGNFSCTTTSKMWCRMASERGMASSPAASRSRMRSHTATTSCTHERQSANRQCGSSISITHAVLIQFGAQQRNGMGVSCRLMQQSRATYILRVERVGAVQNGLERRSQQLPKELVAD